LLLAAVADGASGGIDGLVMLDSETTPSIPDGVDEFVLGDDAATGGDENRENVEYLRLYGDRRPRP
jgi:hypothetical protein